MFELYTVQLQTHNNENYHISEVTSFYNYESIRQFYMHFI